MRFGTPETFEQERERRAVWRPWFAWYPVEVTRGDWRWLEYVERREHYYHCRFFWYYRPDDGFDNT